MCPSRITGKNDTKYMYMYVHLRFAVINSFPDSLKFTKRRGFCQPRIVLICATCQCNTCKQLGDRKDLELGIVANLGRYNRSTCFD